MPHSAKLNLVEEIRAELHSRIDSMLDRLLRISRSQTLEEITGKLGEISELPSDGPPSAEDIPFVHGSPLGRPRPGSRATDPNIVDAILKARDEEKAEWNEIVHRLNQAKLATVTGVPWTRDNVIKLYQTAKVKLRKRSSGLKLQGKYMGLLRAVPAQVGKEAKGLRKSEGLKRAVSFLESARKKASGGSTKVSKLKPKLKKAA